MSEKEGLDGGSPGDGDSQRSEPMEQENDATDSEELTSEDGESDNDSQTDDSGEETEPEEEDGLSAEDVDSGAESIVEESEESSSGDESERCPICLSKFRNQDIGSPESCDHSFCLECIVEWSKNVNTCPSDRQVFHIILAKHAGEGTIFKRIAVQDHTQGDEDATLDDTTECEICGNSTNEDRMLLCDSCNHGYHLYCLTPTLDRVPRGMWYCPVCVSVITPGNQQLNASNIEESESEEEVIRPYRPRRRPHQEDSGIQIGRTLIRDRVLAAITRIRGGTRVIESDSEWEGDQAEPGTSQSGSGHMPRAKPKRKTYRRKRRTTKRKTRKTAKSSGSARKRKTTKRKPGRKKSRKKTKRLARTKKLAPKTAKVRIAGRLGLSSPPTGRDIPMVRCQKERSFQLMRGDIGLRALNILGEQNSIVSFSDGSDVEDLSAAGSLAVARRAFHRSGPSIRRKNAAVSAAVPDIRRLGDELPLSSPAGTPCDLLGGILNSQQMLMTKCDKVKIHRDGSLTQVSPDHFRLKYQSSVAPSDGGSEPRTPEKSSSDQPSSQTRQASETQPSSTSQPTSDSQVTSGGSQDNYPSLYSPGVTGGLTGDASPHDDWDGSPSHDANTKTPKSRAKTSSNASLQDPSQNDKTNQLLKAPSQSPGKDQAVDTTSDQPSPPSTNQAVDTTSDQPSSPVTKPPASGHSQSAVSEPDSTHTDTMDYADSNKDLVHSTNDQTGELDENESSSDTDTEPEQAAVDSLQVVAFSELPRIPKFKRKSRESVESSEGDPHAGVLQRLNLADKKHSYSKWSKKEDGSRYSESQHDDSTQHSDSKHGERSRSSDKHTSRQQDHKHNRTRSKGDARNDGEEHRDRYKDRAARDRDDNLFDYSSSSRHKSRRRSRSHSRDRDRDKSYYNRSRSRDKDRDRDRDRDRERNQRSRSKDRYRRRSRSRDRRSDSGRYRSSRRSRSRTHSPRPRDDFTRSSTRDSGRSRSEHYRHEEDHKSASRIFSQSLKEASESAEPRSSRPFKLKRNFLEDIKAKQAEEKMKFDSQRDASSHGMRSNTPDPEVTIVSQSEPITVIELDRDRSIDDNSSEMDDMYHSVRPPSPQEPFRQEITQIPDKLVYDSHNKPPGIRPPSPPVPGPDPLDHRVFKPREGREDTYDPSEPTVETSASPPVREMFMPSFGSSVPPERQSPLQPRLPFGDLLRTHRPPLLADPVPHEPAPHQAPPFVTMTENIGQVLPGLPGFLQSSLQRSLRPPLLVNPPLLGPPQIGGLPRLSGTQLRWQVSHPNVILHNRLPIPVSQNGLPLHATAPEAFLHRQQLEHGVPENLATPPPPLPPKALEEMQQISQLLNAQAQLAHFSQAKEPAFPGDRFPHKTSNDLKSVTFDETMEVVDMDVASPLSDDAAVSFSPPQDSILENEPRYDYRRPGSNHHERPAPPKPDDKSVKSAAELNKSVKYMKKLNHQERVIEEVKLAIKPFYSKGKVTKAEYKEIMRKAVPKICHSRSGDINPEKIRNYVEQYVKKIRLAKKYEAKKSKTTEAVHL